MGVGSGGDYAQERRWYTDKTTDVDYSASAVGNAITPKTSSHQLWIQKITYSPTTVAAVAITLDDDSSSGPIGLVPASQATPYTIDFGPKGIALGVGGNLDIGAAAGVAGKFHIEAYEKLGAAISYLSGAANQ